MTIAELAEIVADVTGFKGSLSYDSSKPDGTPRKLLDAGRLRATGWQHRIALHAGVRSTYEWFLAHHDSARMIAI